MLVELEQEVCTHCRTPRDDMEMEEGRALVRNEELRRRRRPKRIAAGVGAALLLASVWLLRSVWTAPLDRVWSEFQAEVEKTRQPDYWLKGRSSSPLLAPVVIPADSPAAPAPAARLPAQVAVSSFIYIQASAPPPHHAPPAPPEPAPPAPPLAILYPPVAAAPPPVTLLPPGPGEIRVHGTVYDLATRQPVKDVNVRFESRRAAARWEAMTNSAGHYEVLLIKLNPDVITVMIEAPGYRKGLLEDRDPPYRERSQQAREDLIAETIDSDLEAVPLRYRESEQIVPLDLVLVPLTVKK